MKIWDLGISPVFECMINRNGPRVVLIPSYPYFRGCGFLDCDPESSEIPRSHIFWGHSLSQLLFPSLKVTHTRFPLFSGGEGVALIPIFMPSKAVLIQPFVLPLAELAGTITKESSSRPPKQGDGCIRTWAHNWRGISLY